jgi:parvulin-like peptidyl-prolyl isomerase
MKKLSLINILFLLLLTTGQAYSALPMGVAATVDGEQIGEISLQKAIDTYVKSKGTDMGALRDPDQFKEIRNKVLDVLIGQELLWQAALKNNLIVSDEVLDQAFQQYKSQFRDEVSFQIKIQEGGYNETSYRENLKEQLSSKMWIQKFVLPEVKVSKDEIQEFYLQNQQKFVEPRQVKARHILIKAKHDANEEDEMKANETLVSIKKQIDEGANFEELAKQYSEGPSASKGGDLGFFGPGNMVKPFEDAAFSLKKGEVSDVIRTLFGFHIIKLEDVKPEKLYSMEEASEQIESFVWQQKAQNAVEDAISKLRKEASIDKRTY